MDFLAEIERDLSVCAVLSKLCHRGKTFQDLPYFESHVMELVQRVDQDETADIICIGIAFMMDAVIDEEIKLLELSQVLICTDILCSLDILVKEEKEEPLTHIVRILEDDRARIVKTHDTNLRLKKLKKEENKELFEELFRQKSILESIHVRNPSQGSGQDQSLN